MFGNEEARLSRDEPPAQGLVIGEEYLLFRPPPDLGMEIPHQDLSQGETDQDRSGRKEDIDGERLPPEDEQQHAAEKAQPLKGGDPQAVVRFEMSVRTAPPGQGPFIDHQGDGHHQDRGDDDNAPDIFRRRGGVFPLHARSRTRIRIEPGHENVVFLLRGLPRNMGPLITAGPIMPRFMCIAAGETGPTA